MNPRKFLRGGIAAILVSGLFSTVPLWGSSVGMQMACTTAGCHTQTGSAPSALVSLAGGTVWAPYLVAGRTTAVEVRVVRGSSVQQRAGFWLTVGAGTLSNSEGSILADGSTANHTTPHTMGADSDEATNEVRFRVNFTAPTSGTTVNVSGWANAVNGNSLSTGDYPVNFSRNIALCYDADGDGYFDQSRSSSSCPQPWDCNDSTTGDGGQDERPGLTERCDNEDNDCDGAIDEGCDDDNDGYCDATMTKQTSLIVSTCNQTASTASMGNDCDDSASTGGNVYPGATEICDDKDNDCDGGTIDEGCDNDGDGYCDASFAKQSGKTVASCSNTPSNASQGDDCADTNDRIYPGATEACNNVDDNCSGAADEGCDDDNDDYCDAALVYTVSSTCSAGGDCMDAPGFGAVYPGALELCDGLDNDCNGDVDDNLTSLTCGLGECQRAAAACVDGIPQSCTPGRSAPETCSNRGQDNDCDGSPGELEDGIFLGDACTVGGAAGICSVGTYACSGATLVCQGAVPSPETCGNTGVDNDCDGNPSELENNVFLGDPCAVPGGQGICATGSYACNGMALICQPDIAPGQIEETCSDVGVDNDCDGDSTEIADGLHSGDLCDTGLPGLCTDGTSSCSSNTLICIENVLIGTQIEICDGLDNDCDGAVDNKSPSLSCGVGACRNTAPACAGGEDNTCQPFEPEDEACDNVDNDCDGAIDEGCDDDQDGYCDASMDFSGASDACEHGGGDCDDSFAMTHPMAAERCDGRDNDCNGDADDNVTIFSCGVGQCSGEGTGCIEGRATNCEGETEPGPEVCDGLDNDCDGLNDNDLALASCGLGQCQNHGTTCSKNSCAPLAVAEPEMCDGLDNDCDGLVDDTDDLPPFECGVGSCRRTGTSCDPASCTPGEPFVEICDGEDNDCNGVTDDGLPSATCGLGECKAIGGSCLPSSCVPRPPTPEICDGLDNDCDGQVDNGCDDDNDGYCDATLTYVASPSCENGPGDCDDELADSYPGARELCDGSDNDCDDDVDEEIASGSIFCGKGACIQPGAACEGGIATDCEPLEPAAQERCDGIDNDCDGVIDEGLGEVTCGEGACRVAVAACLRGETVECRPFDTRDEVCDGIDNDCDGEIDDRASCDSGECIGGRCVRLTSGQGGASGLLDYSGLDDNLGAFLDDLGGAGSELSPKDDPKDPGTGGSEDFDDDDSNDKPSRNQRGCSYPSEPSPGGTDSHLLWYAMMTLFGIVGRRRGGKALCSK